MAATSMPSSDSASYTLMSELNFYGAPVSKIEEVKSKLERTIEQVASQALKISSEISGARYFSKSMNHIPYPVVQLPNNDNFAIIKVLINLDRDFNKKGCFDSGSSKKVYFAVKLPNEEFLIEEVINSRVYAWGVSRTDKYNLESFEEILSNEVEMLKECGKELAIEVFGQSTFAILDKMKNCMITRYGILMEYCREILFEPFVDEKISAYSAEKFHRLIGNLLNALAYFETKKICHLDIKLENIFLLEEEKVKFCDFGYSRKIGEASFAPVGYGSTYYIAPEFYDLSEIYKDNKSEIAQLPTPLKENCLLELGRLAYTSKQDIFSMGVLIYIICFNSYPHEHDFEDANEYMVQMVKDKSKIADLYLKYLNRYEFMGHKRKSYIPLLRGMLEFDPDSRFNLKQCKEAFDAIKIDKTRLV